MKDKDSHWNRVNDLFVSALKRSGAERNSFIAQSCRDDTNLRQEIESLLQSYEKSSDFLPTPAFQDAVDLIAEGESAVVPIQIGPYRVLKEIGRGGMGAVYLGVRESEGFRREVALKIVKRGMDTDFVLKRFFAERATLSSFDHPNIARLIDGGATDDRLPYFAMEYVRGVPIDDYCRNHHLSIPNRLKLFQQVCSAVQYAHQHLVIHRDLKPSNILITDEGQPKLLDFGIAKLLSPEAEMLTVTEMPLRVMTLEYASPEQLRGQPVTTASDVYSLGVILYELLTAQKPYQVESRTALEVARAITERAATKPSTDVARSEGSSKSQISNPKHLRGDLDNITLKAINPDSSRRYASVIELSDDIRRQLEGLPVSARRDTFGYRAGKFVRRNKIAVGVAALALFILISGSVAVAWEGYVARQAQVRAERRLQDVRKLAHKMLFDYNDALKEVRGATALRAKLVNDALRYLDNLSAEAANDRALQGELAAAYEKVGDLQALPPTMGDAAGGLESYRKAVQIREALAKSNLADVGYRRDLALSYRNFARVLWLGSDTASAVAIGAKAIAIQRVLAAAEPNDPDTQLNLVASYWDMGQMVEEQGHAVLCEQNYREAAKIVEAMVVHEPNNLRYQRVAYLVHESIGELRFFQADTSNALSILRDCAAQMEGMAAKYPDNAAYRHNAGLTYERIGEADELVGDEKAAIEMYRKALTILRTQTDIDPTNALFRGKFAEALHHLSAVQAKMGNFRESLENSRKALTIRKELSETNPADGWARAALMQSAGKTANVMAHVDENAAVEACRQALEILNRSNDDPTNMSQRGFRADAYRDLGDAYAAIGEPTIARDSYRKALDIWVYMRNNDLLFGQDAPKIGALEQAIARCDAAIGSTASVQ